MDIISNIIKFLAHKFELLMEIQDNAIAFEFFLIVASSPFIATIAISPSFTSSVFSMTAMDPSLKLIYPLSLLLF